VSPVLPNVPDNSVTSAKIVDGEVKSVDIGNGEVNTEDLASGAIKLEVLHREGFEDRIPPGELVVLLLAVLPEQFLMVEGIQRVLECKSFLTVQDFP
jgi:hypothetical protein